MKRPVTVLGAGKKADAPSSNASTAYAVVPLVIGLPIMGYFMAAANHLNVERFTPLLFITTALGLAAVFMIAAKEQKEKARDERKKKMEAKKAATTDKI